MRFRPTLEDLERRTLLADEVGAGSVLIANWAVYEWIPQAYTYVRSSDGQEFAPENAKQLIAVVRYLEDSGLMLDYLLTKGHGGYDGVIFSQTGQEITTPTGLDGRRIFISNTDVTATLNTIVDDNTTIDMRNCYSYWFGIGLKEALGDEGRIYGSPGVLVGIPGSYHTIGVFEEVFPK